MSKYQFKVGDKVKYKAKEHRAAIAGGHDPYKVYTIRKIEDFDYVWFDWCDDFCFSSRLELVQESTPETFNYCQALKILAENPDVEIEFSANGVFWGKIAILGEIRIPTGKEFCFRLNPRPKKYQWLYKTKDGKYGVTYSGYSSKEEAEANCSACGEIFIKLLNEETL